MRPPLVLRPPALRAGRLALLLLSVPGCHWLFPHHGGADAGPSGERRPSELGSEGLPPLPAVRALAAGGRHTCVLFEDDTIRCFGDGERGQLGDGQLSRTPAAVQVKTPPGARPVELAAGGAHSCYRAGGAVWCWGDNSERQTAPESDEAILREPHQVGGLGDVRALALGARETCVVRDSGVACFGRGATLHDLPGTGGARAVACGGEHCCALLETSVRCWGRSPHGQAGVIKDEVSTPTAVAGVPPDAVELGCGDTHCCTRSARGTLECWGENGVYQLGDHPLGDYSAAVTVATAGVAGLAVGGYHACVRDASDEVRCFGYDRFGQLGRGTLGGVGSSLVAIVGLTARAVAAGMLHGCAVAGDARRELWCWGMNAQGQAGVSPATSRAQPLNASVPAADELVTGGNHTCARSGGELRCWGYNAEGELGDGTTTSRGTPALVPIPAGATAWQGVGRGGLHTCGIVGGEVHCWGAGWAGQLGQATPATSAKPVPVSGVKDAASVVGGHDHTCALTTSGTVLCWGSNARGQLGSPPLAPTPRTAAPVAGLPAITALDTRNATACAIDEEKQIWCWGDNRGLQLGPGVSAESRPSPGHVTGAPLAAEVAVGGHHVCARTASTVFCWGENSVGQLGDGTTASRATPREVPALADVAQLCAGWRHTCARREDGAVLCWGTNLSRQAGVADGPIIPKPTLVLEAGAIDLRCGWEHTCVRLGDRSVRCWGSFHLGQLGDGQIATTASPVRIYP